MPRKSKNRLANERYGEDFENLSPAEKAAITRAYNAQDSGSTRPARATPVRSHTVSATIGRLGHNGTQTCLLEEGATVIDLVDQSGYDLDEDKESVIARSSGVAVDLDDEVVDGETYVISPEVKSA